MPTLVAAGVEVAVGSGFGSFFRKAPSLVVTTIDGSRGYLTYFIEEF